MPSVESVNVAPIRMLSIEGDKYIFAALIPALSPEKVLSSHLNIVFKLSSSSITSFNVISDIE